MQSSEEVHCSIVLSHLWGFGFEFFFGEQTNYVLENTLEKRTGINCQALWHCFFRLSSISLLLPICLSAITISGCFLSFLLQRLSLFSLSIFSTVHKCIVAKWSLHVQLEYSPPLHEKSEKMWFPAMMMKWKTLEKLKQSTCRILTLILARPEKSMQQTSFFILC